MIRCKPKRVFRPQKSHIVKRSRGNYAPLEAILANLSETTDPVDVSDTLPAWLSKSAVPDNHDWSRVPASAGSGRSRSGDRADCSCESRRVADTVARRWNCVDVTELSPFDPDYSVGLKVTAASTMAVR